MIGSIQETHIPSGPIVLTQSMSGVQTTAIGLFIQVGSRDEDDALAGIAHALEHMLYKGTQHLDVHALSEAWDQLGGAANAFTERERTCFHCLVLQEDWRKALALLKEMVMEPSLPKMEWERERQIILSEMAMVEDNPEDWLYDRHFLALFPGQAIGRSPLGRRRTLLTIETQHLEGFLKQHYRPPRLLVAAAGAISHEALVEEIAKTRWPFAQAELAREAPRMAHGVQLLERKAEQVHLVVSFPGPAIPSEERSIAWVVNQLLGGGMSSHLFREVREKRGLAYHVGSHLLPLSDTGVWSVYCSTPPDQALKCIRVLRKTLKQFPERFTRYDFERAKRQVIIQLRMSMDTVEANMLRLGDRLDCPSIESPWDRLKKVDAVTYEDAVQWSSLNMHKCQLWSVAGVEQVLKACEQELQP